MLLSSVAPRTAAAAGLATRYLYWCGRSGRRYLFTSTDHASLADFDGGVAVAAVNGRLVWAGEAADLARMPKAAGLSRPALYVHLLAATPEERRAVVDDLKPAEAGVIYGSPRSSSGRLQRLQPARQPLDMHVRHA